MKKPLVRLSDVDASYNGNLVLKNINLTVYENDFIGVIGPNGGGKTTLMKIILGLLKPVRGSVVYGLDENKVCHTGYLPQHHILDKQFPVRVYEVVLSGLNGKGGLFFRKTKQSIEKVDEILHKLGIIQIRDKVIGELSGGQMQRALLARAIISLPELLVLDEPDTYVDNTFERELYEILADINKSTTIIIVSHDAGMISTYVKTIACVNQNLHYHPTNEITEEILKSYNCPIELITHGHVPHRVLKFHNNK